MEEGINYRIYEESEENTYTLFDPGDYKTACASMTEVSTWLSVLYPDFFVPYLYNRGFYELSQVCQQFDIFLPTLPKKSKHKERAMYYLEVCRSLQDFKTFNKLSNSELCAFLYDYAPRHVREDEGQLPAPVKAWFVGGAGTGGDAEFLEKATKDSFTFWQGSEDIRRGDIVLMYCRAPKSYIQSIWIAQRDGFSDPFFYHYGCVYLSNCIKVKPISHNELKENKIWSTNATVRRNLQGISGDPISFQEYEEMLAILKSKGQNLAELPKLASFQLKSSELISNERQVEVFLVEPLLEKLGYTSKDWVRQMAVRMGRGERNYPDYAFNATIIRGKEKADWLLEAKFHIKNQNELKDAFYQVRSYALRLQAAIIVIADKSELWIIGQKSGDFDLGNAQSFTWVALESPDNLRTVDMKIGLKRKRG